LPGRFAQFEINAQFNGALSWSSLSRGELRTFACIVFPQHIPFIGGSSIVALSIKEQEYYKVKTTLTASNGNWTCTGKATRTNCGKKAKVTIDKIELTHVYAWPLGAGFQRTGGNVEVEDAPEKGGDFSAEMSVEGGTAGNREAGCQVVVTLSNGKKVSEQQEWKN